MQMPTMCVKRRAPTDSNVHISCMENHRLVIVYHLVFFGQSYFDYVRIAIIIIVVASLYKVHAAKHTPTPAKCHLYKCAGVSNVDLDTDEMMCERDEFIADKMHK